MFKSRLAVLLLMFLIGIAAAILPIASSASINAATVSPVVASPQVNTATLRAAVRPAGVFRHLAVFQRIADRTEGNRAAGTTGYDASAQYVYNQLDRAGYNVSFQEFPFFFFRAISEEGRQISPTQRDLEPNTLTFSPSTPAEGIERPIAVVPEDDTTGCEASDFAGQDFTDKIALIKRGSCTFWLKAQNAGNVGAVATIIYNNSSNPDAPFGGTLVDPANISIPVVGITRGLGEALAADTAGGTQTVTVYLNIQTTAEERITTNVLAETRQGRADRVIVVGAHLDSVAAGAGINDNGSGSAGILEIALQMAKLQIQPENKVRFAFWGAEELGLVGSRYYVNQLNEEEIANIALNLNFDMIGSLNFARFVYDGDNSAFPPGPGSSPGPAGSDVIEQVFHDYFSSQGLASAETPFSGRSDYGPFIAVGIPAGGLFTGAGGVKSVQQAEIYGGTAGEAFDKCYHRACDTLENVNLTALDQMSDAAAHAVLTFAMTALEDRDTTAAVAPATSWDNSAAIDSVYHEHDHNCLHDR
ncbi:MAG: M20/M25/M40 family metallo-hydrolase [Chloroflexales bacterium]|nr:M20/M25/M40 family metallo-hydrolase [Chloroflexales bacterium]